MRLCSPTGQQSCQPKKYDLGDSVHMSNGKMAPRNGISLRKLIDVLMFSAWTYGRSRKEPLAHVESLCFSSVSCWVIQPFPTSLVVDIQRFVKELHHELAETIQRWGLKALVFQPQVVNDSKLLGYTMIIFAQDIHYVDNTFFPHSWDDLKTFFLDSGGECPQCKKISVELRALDFDQAGCP